jgi:hypothetical protein
LIAEDDGLRELLRSLSPSARGHFRNVLIHDQADRDAIASSLMRYRDQNGQAWSRHHRHADDASGGTAEGCAATRGDSGVLAG